MRKCERSENVQQQQKLEMSPAAPSCCSACPGRPPPCCWGWWRGSSAGPGTSAPGSSPGRAAGRDLAPSPSPGNISNNRKIFDANNIFNCRGGITKYYSPAPVVTSLDCTTQPKLDLIFSKQLAMLSWLIPLLQSSIMIVRKPSSCAWNAVEAENI